MVRVQHFFDQATFTLSYILFDEVSREAVILDPVLDYEPWGSQVSTRSVAELVNFIKTEGLKVKLILETHAHADHLSGSQEIKRVFPEAKLAIGRRISEVQAIFKKVYNLPAEFPTDGRQFDRLLHDGERVELGSLSFQVLFTPGHTPACASYVFEDKVFTGDALFMPDYGTGRCDFPGGSAAVLFESITRKLYTLPEQTKVYTGHDYMPNGRELRFQSTIGEQKAHNIQLSASTRLDEYVQFRETRDKKLDAPKLLHQSVQVYIDAGHLPQAEDNGLSYLKMPLFLSKI